MAPLLSLINWTLLEHAIEFAVVMYLVAPLLVFSRVRIPYSPDLREASWEDFLIARSQAFLTMHRQLTELNFRPVACATLRSSNAALPFALYERDADATIATLMAGTNARGEDATLEYLQRYEGGRLLSLSNSRSVGIYPSWEKKIKFRWAGAHSAAELLGVFQSIASALPGEFGALPLPTENPLSVVIRHIEDENDYMRRQGYFALEPDTKQMKPTLKGAFLFSWRLTWPWSTLSKWRAAPPLRHIHQAE